MATPKREGALLPIYMRTCVSVKNLELRPNDLDLVKSLLTLKQEKGALKVRIRPFSYKFQVEVTTFAKKVELLRKRGACKSYS